MFNLFDLTGNGRIDRDKLKRLSVALMTSPTAAAPSAVDPSKEFAPLLDLFAFFALHAYDRDGDRQLSWVEWRLYAEDDERIRRMVDEISSRRARRKEREARYGNNAQQTLSKHAQQQQQVPAAQALAGKGGGAATPTSAAAKKETGEADGGGVDDDDWLLSDADDDDEAEVDAVQTLAWSEWMGCAVGDESEWSAWEEYRNVMRTAANRMTTPTMEAMDDERRRGGGRGGTASAGGGDGSDGAVRSSRPHSGLPPLAPTSSSTQPHVSSAHPLSGSPLRGAPSSAAAGGASASSSSPSPPSSSGHPHIASTRSPLLQSTTRNLVNTVAVLRGKK